MSLTVLLLYGVACFSVTVLPGPTMLLALANGTTGRRSVIAAGILGAALSDVLLITAVSLGLGAMLTASETIFRVVKWVGVAYLCWLAMQLWRSGPVPLVIAGDTPPRGSRHEVGRAFRRSLFVALSNPKGLLFFSAFVPQFIDTAAPLVPQYALLAACTAVLDALAMVCYAAGGAHAVRFLTANAMRRLNRGCAAVLGSFAALLALYRRA
ncbi:LysE family translocator [Piscinibacter gummiphilus]|uniref:Lysine transporter LysE n=1 Tax=Piscinibacter gummiphilus TaxID=946333 RepID=A0A1W6LCV7_9BURK|nr:LysE family translocator [Piscinibacter gummiphilus]ARN22069.1 lysine transporter LysE [Piscinibacter gummiphilus]ATU66757.1 LysE family translocator [Piscinibacter gummiphilus]GLS94152.1 amino acid transporter [Piscinibacter gummiphilus]